MSFKHEIGVRVHIPGGLSVDKLLFGETGGFVLEVGKGQVQALTQLFEQAGVPIFMIGETSSKPRLQMNGVIDLAVEEARKAWVFGLRDRLL